MPNEFLPLFPLELAVFPGEKLKLHIFEPRYKQLINECKDHGTMFGIPPFVDGKLAEYGTKMQLLNILSVDDAGEMDIVTEGVSAFRLEQFLRAVPEKLYSAGYVTLVENDEGTVPETTAMMARLFARFHEVLETGYERDNFNGRNISFQVAQEVGLTIAQKVELLSLPKESQRQDAIVDHLRTVIPMLGAAKESAQESKRRVRGNGHIIHPQKLDF